MPTPSLMMVPSAPSPKAFTLASPARPRCLLKSWNVDGLGITVTPPASAMSHSPERSACTARCSVTRDDEHAVSTVSVGPSRPSVYAMRPLAMLPTLPLPTNASRSDGTSPSAKRFK